MNQIIQTLFKTFQVTLFKQNISKPLKPFSKHCEILIAQGVLCGLLCNKYIHMKMYTPHRRSNLCPVVLRTPEWGGLCLMQRRRAPVTDQLFTEAVKEKYSRRNTRRMSFHERMGQRIPNEWRTQYVFNAFLRIFLPTTHTDAT